MVYIYQCEARDLKVIFKIELLLKGLITEHSGTYFIKRSSKFNLFYS